MLVSGALSLDHSLQVPLRMSELHCAFAALALQYLSLQWPAVAEVVTWLDTAAAAMSITTFHAACHISVAVLAPSEGSRAACACVCFCQSTPRNKQITLHRYNAPATIGRVCTGAQQRWPQPTVVESILLQVGLTNWSQQTQSQQKLAL